METYESELCLQMTDKQRVSRCPWGREFLFQSSDGGDTLSERNSAYNQNFPTQNTINIGN